MQASPDKEAAEGSAAAAAPAIARRQRIVSEKNSVRAQRTRIVSRVMGPSLPSFFPHRNSPEPGHETYPSDGSKLNPFTSEMDPRQVPCVLYMQPSKVLKGRVLPSRKQGESGMHQESGCQVTSATRSKAVTMSERGVGIPCLRPSLPMMALRASHSIGRPSRRSTAIDVQ